MTTTLKLVKRKNIPSTEVHFTRLEVVRCMAAQGKGIPLIIADLEGKGLLSSSQSYSARYRLVCRLVQKVRQDGMEQYKLTREESNDALVGYIERHMLLFRLAISSNQLEVARNVSKDLGRAHGIDVDRPTGIAQPDLASIMLGMKTRSLGKEAPLPAPALTIDISPLENN